jgi:hypothetical protein
LFLEPHFATTTPLMIMFPIIFYNSYHINRMRMQISNFWAVDSNEKKYWQNSNEKSKKKTFFLPVIIRVAAKVKSWERLGKFLRSNLESSAYAFFCQNDANCLCSFFYRCDRFHFSPQTNRIRYHKSFFAFNWKLKKLR